MLPPLIFFPISTRGVNMELMILFVMTRDMMSSRMNTFIISAAWKKLSFMKS